MSKLSDFFEAQIVKMVNAHAGQSLPSNLPTWLMDEGVAPGARILGAVGIGSQDRKNKTDVVIYLEQSEPIKISAKLRNADYFGNWYGHQRFLEEFGSDAFLRMTAAATLFANRWARTATAPYVGVSICFGKRTGHTGQRFTEIFTIEDILTVARGYGDGISVANCMYIADTCASDIPGLINSLEAITIESVNRVAEEFKVIYRPINPITEGTNRGKNVYTRFLPEKRLDTPTVISDPELLFSLGRFVEVGPSRLNHNHILDDLEDNYNIIIPRKEKKIEY